MCPKENRQWNHLGRLGFERRNRSALLFAAISGFAVLLFAALAVMFPYSGDDWAWGSRIGAERLQNFFDNYNGRYLGNFLILAISRSKVLEVVLMALCYYGACWLCYRYTPVKSNGALVLALVLFFMMPQSMYTQAVVWASGFSNYVPSALISLAYILMVRNITGTEAPRYRKGLWIVTFLMGFCGAPFIENVALFNICLGIAVIGYTALRFRKVLPAHLGFLGGAVAGAIWMFTNSAYGAISSGSDSYRNVPTGLSDMIARAWDNGFRICNYVVISNQWICAVVGILLVVLAIRFAKTTDSPKKKWMALGAMAVNALCLLVILGRSSNAVYAVVGKVTGLLGSRKFLMLLTGTFALSAWAVVMVCVEKGRRFAMLLPFYCIPVAVLPLLLVDPIGPRCFFISYLLTMAFVVDLFGYVTQGVKFNKTILVALAAVLLVQAVAYVSIFLPIYRYDSKRNDFAKLQSENGERTIVVSALPNDSYVWTGTPTAEPWVTRYKLFYDLEEDAQIQVLDPEAFDTYYKEYMGK